MLALLLQNAAEGATTASGYSGGLAIASTIITLTLTLALGIIKILQQRKELATKGEEMDALETTKRVALVVMGALDKAKPALGTEKAKQMTGAITSSAKDAGVLGDLDALLRANGLNS